MQDERTSTTSSTGATRSGGKNGAAGEDAERDLDPRPLVGVIGGGRMALAVARIAAAATVPLRVFARRPDQREAVAAVIGSGGQVVDTLAAAVEEATLVFLAVPAQALDAVAECFGPHARGDHIVVHASRGVGEGFTLPHQMIRRHTCVRKIAVLGGPLHAQDIDAALPLPLPVLVGSRFAEAAQAVRALSRGTQVHVHETRDIVGVEVAGALSNVTQIAAGMAEALELGDTARGVILTRGLLDASKLGLRLGAAPATFSGLAGIGDLIPRRVSSTGRHRALGALLGRGVGLAAAEAELRHHVEGVVTARAAAALAPDLPLVRAVTEVLDGRKGPREALEAVLRLDLDLDARPAAGARLE